MYVTCPSYAINSPSDRAGLLSRARLWADELGWEVVASPLLERYLQSGAWLPAEERAADMARALEHEVVWACRGGYAAIDLAQPLLQASAPGRPLLIGYSDTTVLHACWAIRDLGPAIYGGLGDQILQSRRGESLRTWLTGGAIEVTQRTEPAARVARPGEVQAPVFAACLVVLANLCGTPAMPRLAGTILAIEDVNERPYAVDFALSQLALSGALDGVVGLLCGSFHHENPADYGGPSIDEVLSSWAARLGVPMVVRLPFGHIDDQLVVPQGARTTLEARADGHWRVRFEHP
jgi:muramoyltetrapeptide carboxypeptidase